MIMNSRPMTTIGNFCDTVEKREAMMTCVRNNMITQLVLEEPYLKTTAMSNIIVVSALN